MLYAIKTSYIMLGEGLESGLISEFADRYWVFRLRPSRSRDAVAELTGKYLQRAVEGNTHWRSLSELSTKASAPWLFHFKPLLFGILSSGL